ncbi:hypothetical protein GCM10018771_55880 [Streptomyces cellulosae]|nr:hypothetical protein GCM10018771_55880 [Streptomyces cellulosae]
MPVICSRTTLVTRSTRCCREADSGICRPKITPIAQASTGSTTTSNSDNGASSPTAITSAPTPITGADTTSVNTSRTRVWICCTSLVALVISEAAPKRPTSRTEKVWTPAKSCARRSLPSAIAVRVLRYTATAAHVIWTSVTPSITPPIRRTCPVSPVRTPWLMASAFSVGKYKVAGRTASSPARRGSGEALTS